MAVAFNLITTIRHFGSDQNTRVTSSFTPTPGAILLVLVDSQNQAGNLNDANGQMSVTPSHAGSWSWTYYGNGSGSTYDPNGATYYGRVHAAFSTVPASPGSGTITLNFNTGGSMNRNRNIVIADIIEVTGTSGVIQNKVGRAGAATSHTLTLDSTPVTTSGVISHVGVSYDADHTNVAPPTGHTEISDYDTANVDFNHSFVSSYDIGSANAALNYTTFPSSTYGSAILGIEFGESATVNKGIPPALFMGA